MLPPTLKWEGDALRLLDQRALPLETKYRICRDYEEVAAAIEDMTVRGAPAIGVAAAYGLALAEREGEFAQAAKRLAATRPTAVNLFWAIKRMEETRAAHKNEKNLPALLALEAAKIHEEDAEINKSIGRYGAALLPDECAAITHCNAGALATAGYGTALGVFRAAAEAGKKLKSTPTRRGRACRARR